jgi:uncharacterized coiled-coil protein SlyX
MSRRRRALLFALGLLVPAGSGQALAEADEAERGGTPAEIQQRSQDAGAPRDEIDDPAELAARIRELEAAIARDEETLLELISAEKGGVLADDYSGRMREIAERLPAMQAELRALYERRASEGER